MKTVARNRRARFDYEILETVEAGMLLTGQEAKSCREGHIDLAGSYVSFHGGKPVLKQAKVAPYRYASELQEYNPQRDRQLLLRSPEIRKLQTASDQKGVTIVPLEVRAGRYIKILLGLGKGRKRVDKREHIKERMIERQLKRGY